MGYRQHLLRNAWLVAAAAVAILVPGVRAGAAKKEAPEPMPQPPAPAGAAGTFQDRDQARHEWHVNGSFALLWEGAPYMPVGMVLKPRSLAEPESAEAWDADRQTLAAWKHAGVRDVLVQPDRPAATIPTTAWQRLLDELESQGFTYGIGLPAAPPRPASGYHVRAGFLRIGPVRGAGEHTLDIRIPGLGGARIERVAAALIDQRNGRMIRLDWAKLEPNGDATRAIVKVDEAPAGDYVIELTPLVTGATGLPDVWEGFGEIRDSLLPLANLKPGRGLRFFVHPLAGAINLDGASGYVIPGSDAYRVELEAFLTRKYRRIETLRSQWAFRGDLPKDIQTAARLVPVAISMSRGRPVGYLLDEKESRCYAIDPGESRLWYDHLYFREHSLREQLNLLAQFLAEQVADVPVVLPRAGSLRYYHINDRASGGFAGVGLTASPDSLTREAATAIGEARLAATRPWCVALAVEGFDTRERIGAALDTLRRAGVKGFFVASSATAANMPAWVASYRQSLASIPDAPDVLPRYLLYPHAIRETGGFGHQQDPVGARPGPLSEGFWWIPTLSGWDPLDIGSDLGGYGLRNGASYQVFMWSREGSRRIHILPHTYEAVEVRDLRGKIVSKYRKRKPLRLDLTEEPLIITGLNPLQTTPIELAKAELEELERLTRELGLRGNSVRELQGTITLARTLNPEEDPRGVRELIREPLALARRLSQAPPPAATGASTAFPPAEKTPAP